MMLLLMIIMIMIMMMIYCFDDYDDGNENYDDE